MKREIDTDRIVERADRERRRKVLAEARANAARKRRTSYAAVLIPEGYDRIEVNR